MPPRLGAAFAVLLMWAPANALPGSDRPGAACRTEAASLEVRMREVSQAYGRGDFAKAEPLLVCLSNEPDADPAVYYYLADTRARLGRRDEARAALERFYDLIGTLDERRLSDYTHELSKSAPLARWLLRVEAVTAPDTRVEDTLLAVAATSAVISLGLTTAFVVSAVEEGHAQDAQRAASTADGLEEWIEAEDTANGAKLAAGVGALVTGLAAVTTFAVWWSLTPDSDAVHVSPILEVYDFGQMGGLRLEGAF